VLVVDDLQELGSELEDAVGPGHEVVRVTSRLEVLRYLKQHDVALVITGLVLETGDYRDGLSLLSSARQRNRHAQAIVVASYSTPEACLAAVQAGVFDYVERNSPGIAFVELLKRKVALALEYERTLAGSR